MNTPVTDIPLSPRVRAGYGLGSVTTGSFGTVPGLMLLPYLTDTLGVAAALAGLIVFLPKAWDVVLNPIVGRISDRSTDPRGPRRPFLLLGGLPLALCFALLFAGPPLGSTALDALWVLVMFLLCATAYAFFQVPYMAMPAEITDSYHERTRLMSWRVGILAFTIMLAGASAPAVRDAFGGQSGYRVMGVLIGVLLLLGVIGSYRGTRTAPIRTASESAGTMREQLRLISSDRAFRLLLIVFVVQALASSTMLASVDYAARWVLEDEGAATALFVCFVGPALLLTPAWGRLGQRLGKRRGYLLASLVWIAATPLLFWAGSSATWWVYTVAALAGIGYSGMQLFPMAMMPDIAAQDARRSGDNRSGVYTGIWTAGETLGMALGPGLYALVLAVGHYRSADSFETIAQQPDSALTAVALGFSLLPSLLVALSLIPLLRYREPQQLP
ncbi:MFS transporter [Kineosporia babensis]|uniref:MFS transporter n=1 Tax=Kineosporia babensis TaxID=499548 RepID=A0A9X1NJN8_9ACTN|nr:MFS transporter [Kineosporia babensis]MCD5314941.1 MFS transporter [Kineosporia babensis]